MIRYGRKKMDHSLKFKSFEVPKDYTIFKLFFEERDIRKIKEGNMHLDIFGNKLWELIENALTVLKNNKGLEIIHKIKEEEIDIKKLKPKTHFGEKIKDAIIKQEKKSKPKKEKKNDKLSKT